MMKYIRICLLAVMAVMLFSAFTTKEKGKDKEKEKPVYIFGVGASFKDSVVYFTGVQRVDSVVLGRGGFLPQREMYAYQMKNYLEYERNKQNYTCAIYFSENRNKLEKEAQKIRKQYEKNDAFVVESVNVADFTFKKPED